MSQQPKLLSRATASQYFSESQTRNFHDNQRGHQNHHYSGNGLRTVAWNVLGTRLAAGGGGGTVKIYNPERTGNSSYASEMKGSGLQITEKIMWDPTHADKFASCGSGNDASNGGVKFWDFRTAKFTAEVKTGGDNISLTYHPDGGIVVVGRKDDQIKFIDLRQNAVFHTIEEHIQTNQQVFSYTGDLLFQTHGTGAVKVRDYPSFETLYTFDAHTSACFCLEMDPKGKYLATGGSDALISIWDTNDWICVRTLDKAEHPIRSVSFSFDGAFIAAGSDEAMPIDIAHVETGEYIHQIPSGHYPIQAVAWHPHKYVLAYGSDILRVLGTGANSSNNNA